MFHNVIYIYTLCKEFNTIKRRATDQSITDHNAHKATIVSRLVTPTVIKD